MKNQHEKSHRVFQFKDEYIYSTFAKQLHFSESKERCLHVYRQFVENKFNSE